MTAIDIGGDVSNEPAKWLRDLLEPMPEVVQQLDQALAAERRATVERIRAAVIARVGAEPRDDAPSIGRAGLFAILDEEAQR